MGFEPPSGVEDLEAQATEIAREREQMEAEHAAILRARQQRQVGRDRTDLERRRAELTAELAELDGVPTVVSTDMAVMTVIDPDGTEYDIDPASGKPYLDDRGEPIPAWPYDTIDFKGRIVQVRAAKAAAAVSISVLGSKHTPMARQNDAVGLFLKSHLSARSYDELMTAMIDPDDDFSDKDFSQLLQRVATMGTARPTKPSRP